MENRVKKVQVPKKFTASKSPSPGRKLYKNLKRDRSLGDEEERNVVVERAKDYVFLHSERLRGSVQARPNFNFTKLQPLILQARDFQDVELIPSSRRASPKQLRLRPRSPKPAEKERNLEQFLIISKTKAFSYQKQTLLEDAFRSPERSVALSGPDRVRNNTLNDFGPAQQFPLSASSAGSGSGSGSPASEGGSAKNNHHSAQTLAPHSSASTIPKFISYNFIYQRQQRIQNYQQIKNIMLDRDPQQKEFRYSTLHRMYAKSRKGLGNIQNMMLILHFDGLMGIYDKPFFQSFNLVIEETGRANMLNEPLKSNEFNEKYLFLRKELKRCLANLSKIYQVVVIMNEKKEMRDIQRSLVREKYQIDAFYQIQGSELVLDYNQILQDFGSKNFKKFLIIDCLPFNPNEVFYKMIPKTMFYFEENPYSYLRHIQVNSSFADCFVNKIPKLRVMRESLKIAYFPSLYYRESKIRNLDSQIIEDIGQEQIYDQQLRNYLQKNRTQWCILNVEQVLDELRSKRRQLGLREH